ncbi:hypothetical protein [Ileibacterium valens]|uniref:hypothetical protein n=1 Tax=Ileibacterium valens TaxID=1862668 RepID=UPI0025707D70|nr:hypothetical protein [Ileibacterium valens]
MKKILPFIAAGAMTFANAAPVFAAEDEPMLLADDSTEKKDDGAVDTPKQDETKDENKEESGDKNEDNPNDGNNKDENPGDSKVDEEVLHTAQEALGKLQAIDRKTLSQEQVDSLDEVLGRLELAITEEDEQGMKEATELATVILESLKDTNEDKKEEVNTDEIVEAGQKLLDNASAALKLNSSKLTEAQIKTLTDLCSALQSAITNKDAEGIQKNGDAVYKAFFDLGIDLNKITEEEIKKANTPDAASKTGAGTAMVTTAAGLGVLTVIAAGMTYKIKKQD